MTIPATILIVEDEIIVAADLSHHLTSLGYTVPEIVPSGEEAIQWIEATPPDLILMDIHLAGDMDGITAAEVIRTRFDLPVVYLTAFADNATLRRARLTQPFGYLLKPFNGRDLHTTIEMALSKHRMEAALRQSEEQYRTVADFTYDWEYWVSPEGRYLYVSPACERITGYRREEFLADPQLLLRIVHPDDRQLVARHYRETLQLSHQAPATADFRIMTRNGQERWIGHVCQAVFRDDGRWLGRRGSNRDITERKQAEAEREKLISELQEALDHVRRLSGLLPICASCKKIRDDRGYWQQVEVYIQEHSEAEFSHGLCPDCKIMLYPKEQYPYLYP
jgi:PAS domain S-box-containing protein